MTTSNALPEIYLETILDGPDLLVANRVLARFGLPQQERPCTLAALLNGVTPIDIRRFCQLTARLDEAFRVARDGNPLGAELVG